MRPVITGTIYQKFYTQFGPSELDIGFLAQEEMNSEGELLQSYTPCPRFVHARCTAGILEMGLTWPNSFYLEQHGSMKRDCHLYMRCARLRRMQLSGSLSNNMFLHIICM